MVGSKNCNDHRNHGGDLVEVEFNAVHVRFTPETGNRLSAFGRPLSAKSGHCLTSARCTRRASYRDQSTLMFAARMTLAHFSVVSARSLA
jgi:hypothetical protein